MSRCCIVLGLAVVVVGCSSSPRPEATQKQLAELGNSLSKYGAVHGDKAPPDEEAFKKFLSEDRKKTDHSDILVSQGDEQPFQIAYSVSYKNKIGKEGLVPPSQQPRILMAREKTGKDGKVWAVYVGGLVEKVDAAAPAGAAPK